MCIVLLDTPVSPDTVGTVKQHWLMKRRGLAACLKVCLAGSVCNWRSRLPHVKGPEALEMRFHTADCAQSLSPVLFLGVDTTRVG